MIVYVVEQCYDYDHYNIHSIWSSEEKAKYVVDHLEDSIYYAYEVDNEDKEGTKDKIK